MVESIGSPITNRLLEDVKITRALIVNWKSYAQSQMITEDDFNFINELDSAEDKQALFLIRNFEFSLYSTTFFFRVMADITSSRFTQRCHLFII